QLARGGFAVGASRPSARDRDDVAQDSLPGQPRSGTEAGDGDLPDRACLEHHGAGGAVDVRLLLPAHQLPSMPVTTTRVRSAVKHRPADVVPQPLVVKHELVNRLRKLVTLPAALEPPGALARAVRRASTRGLDRIGGRAEFVRGDVRDGPGLASG